MANATNSKKENVKKETKKTVKKEAVSTVEQPKVEVTKENTDMQKVMEMIASLKDEVASLKKERDDLKAQQDCSSNGDLTAILNAVVNNRNNKEVVIRHNIQPAEGLKTVIKLSSYRTEFRTLGEERSLTWQQFEELQSIYDSYFKKGILILGEGYKDLADKYGYISYENNSPSFLTPKKLNDAGNLGYEELEDFFKGLDRASKNCLLGYWLTKCYDKDDARFLDRYKLELLDRLSKTRLFVPIITEMNWESLEEENGR